MAQIATQVTDSAVSNTALNSQSLGHTLLVGHLDWLSLSCTISGSRRLDKFIEDVQNYFDISFFFDKPKIKDDYSGRYQTFSGSLGCSLSYSNINNDDVYNARITLSGEFLASRAKWHVKRRLQYLNDNFGLRCTRVDIAVDDYDKQLDFSVIESSSRAKEGVGFSSGKTVDSYNSVGCGITVYCGSRRSPKYARFYEKGEFNRFEIEYKQQYAEAIFTDFMADTTPTGEFLLSSILASSISFAYKPDKNLSRSITHQWWLDFTARISYKIVRYKIVKPRPSLDRTLRWIHRSVSKSLLLMREALGTCAMNQMLQLWEQEARLRCDQSDSDRLLQFKLQDISLDELMTML